MPAEWSKSVLPSVRGHYVGQAYIEIPALQSFYFKNNRFDPIGTAGDEIIFVFHPGTEVTLGH